MHHTQCPASPSMTWPLQQYQELKPLYNSNWTHEKNFQMLLELAVFFICSSSYGVSGAIILVISVMQDATNTFTSISACLKSSIVTNAFTEGKSASCIDLDGAWSTFANKFLTLSIRGRRSSMEEWGLRRLFPSSLGSMLKISIKGTHF